MINIVRELSIHPRRGRVPFATTLLFRAEATGDDVELDVIYRIDPSSEGEIDVAFETEAGPSREIRRNGVVFTAITRGVSRRVTLVQASGAPAALATIRACLVQPGTVGKGSDQADMTVGAVRILRS